MAVRGYSVVIQVFPFGVAFDDQLTVVYVGRTLQKVFDADPRPLSRRSSTCHRADATSCLSPRQNVQLIGRPLGQHFTLIRPQMTDLTWQNVRITVVIIIIITGNSNNTNIYDMRIANIAS